MIGAGPSGIAAGAAARARGIEALVLEAGDRIAHRWRSHYDRLYLQSLRRRSGLPGRPIPRRAGRWVSRDAYGEYLDGLAAESGAMIEFGSEVRSIDPCGGRWLVSTDRVTYRAEQVVVATGQNRTPKIPEWPGLGSFTGRVMHARDYRNADGLEGQDVLVVGGGQTAAEICTELVERGAARVWMAVRSPPLILPRQFTRYLCIQDLLSVVGRIRLPAPMLDRLLAALHAAYAGDLAEHGLGRPAEGMLTRLARGGGAPILDGVGFVRTLKTGAIEIVPGVEAFEASHVLCGSRRLRPDLVIAATGYRPGLESLVGHLGVLDDQGHPEILAPEPALPGLYFLGFEFSLAGLLWRMGRVSPMLAETIVDRPRRPDSSGE